MTLRTPLFTISLTALALGVLLLTGCAEEPIPAPVPTPPGGGAGTLPAGHPPVGNLPAGHPPAGGAMGAGMGVGMGGGMGAGAGAAAPAAPFSWDVPEGWTQLRGANSMRLAQFPIPGTEGTKTPVECVVFGGIVGGTDANIARWIGQFKQADGSNSKDAAKVTKSEVSGLQVTRLHVTGTFGAQMVPGKGEALNAAKWGMLGAVIEGDAGTIFLKLVGPADVLDGAAASFDALLNSMRPAGN